MTTNVTILITFGPVQEFIEQSRRTRDLWASSYLISVLCGKAIAEIKKANSQVEVVVPSIEQSPLFKAIMNGTSPEPPYDRIGSLPDIMEINVPAGQESFLASKAVEAWEKFWEAIQRAVWNYMQDQANILLTDETKKIWQRQVKHFWYSRWVAGSRSHLAYREQTLNFYVPGEPGEKCTVCGDREVLWGTSGTSREVRAFWKAICDKLPPLDIRGNGRERLCAVCTVKRLFPRVAQNAIRWPVPTAYPSTATMASLIWRQTALEKSRDNAGLREALTDYIMLLNKHLPKADYRIGAASYFPRLKLEVVGHPLGQIASDILEYDGDFYFPDALKSLITDNLKLSHRTANEISISQSNLLKIAAKAGVGMPSPFYALLVMDGDNMGKILDEYKAGSRDISEALWKFSDAVAKIKELPDSYALIVYAGGDDVFALLPVDTALTIARRMREAYIQAFKDCPVFANGKTHPTISAAIVYAHMQSPLQVIVHQAHELLNDVAKDQTGRDAFAIEVWKRGGPALCFARPWETQDKQVSWVQIINELRDALEEGMYSSSFIHRLKERCDFLVSPDSPVMNHDYFVDFMTTEYQKSRQRIVSSTEAKSIVEKLLSLSIKRWHHLDGTEQTGQPEADPALFLRFLVQKEV